jgi:hypothetical protein
MKRFSAFALVSTVLALAPVLSAETGARGGRQPRVVARPTGSGLGRPAKMIPSSVTATSYSVQLNIVTRVQGLALYRTAVDITNNTASDPVTATFQYCFNFNGAFQGCTTQQSIGLHRFDSFHTDDMVQYLGTLAVLPPGAEVTSFGTLIVTFDGLPSNNGWEGTVTARTYSPVAPAGTVAIAYPGSLFFESAQGSLVGIVRDTTLVQPQPDAGALRTNLGVTNTALDNPTDSVNFAVSFYDVETGLVTGSTLTPPHPLAPGEVFQFNDVFTAANIPSSVTSCIVFVDVTTPQPVLPLTIEGYISTLDGGTNDGAYFEMKCAAGCPGGIF